MRVETSDTLYAGSQKMFKTQNVFVNFVCPEESQDQAIGYSNVVYPIGGFGLARHAVLGARVGQDGRERVGRGARRIGDILVGVETPVLDVLEE